MIRLERKDGLWRAVIAREEKANSLTGAMLAELAELGPLLAGAWAAIEHLEAVRTLALVDGLTKLANRRSFDVALALMPIYLLFISLVVVPAGVYTYVKMAWADRKVGVIRRARPSRGAGGAQPAGLATSRGVSTVSTGWIRPL